MIEVVPSPTLPHIACVLVLFGDTDAFITCCTLSATTIAGGKKFRFFLRRWPVCCRLCASATTPVCGTLIHCGLRQRTTLQKASPAAMRLTSFAALDSKAARMRRRENSMNPLYFRRSRRRLTMRSNPSRRGDFGISCLRPVVSSEVEGEGVQFRIETFFGCSMPSISVEFAHAGSEEIWLAISPSTS